MIKKIKEYFEEKSQLRSPCCNCSHFYEISGEEWEEEYKQGFRYYCPFCDKCFVEPVVDLSNIQKAVDGVISDSGKYCNDTSSTKPAHLWFNEKELSNILRDLPLDHELRSRLQEAGNNIFGW